MTQIYRIHKRTDLAVGPYMGMKDGVWFQYTDQTPSGRNHPAIWEDAGMHKKAADMGLFNEEDPSRKLKFSDMYFGFSSIEAIHEWFYQNDWLLALWDNDFIISMLEVPNDILIVGEKQLFFKLKDKRVQEIDYKEIVDICTDAQVAAMKGIKQRLLVTGQLRTLE